MLDRIPVRITDQIIESSDIGGNTATAGLTIRGTTNPETITDIVITENADGTVKATGKLVFDRQKYNVAWKHYLKDAILADNIELTVELNGNAAQ